MIKIYLRCLLGTLWLCVASPGFAEDTPVVVVNSITYPNAFLSQNAITAIFGMRLRKWEDGSPIKVFVMPDGNPIHIAFSKYVLRVFPYQLRSAWNRLVFSGTGEEPMIVESEEKMREAISSTPGAIGYLSRSMLNESVKAISND